MNTSHKDGPIENQPEQSGLNEAMLLRIAELVAQKLAQPPLEMWSVVEIAAYLKLSERHVQDRVTKAPGFPKGFLIPGTGNLKQRIRWRREDIIKWSKP